MGKEREAFEPWLERYLRPRYPELEAPLMAAVDAFDSAQQTGQLRPSGLAAIVDAVASSRTPLYENATRFLAKLSADHPEACEAIARLSKSPKAHARFNAILSLGRSTPPELVDSVLTAGLMDKSARVRTKAADWAGRLRNTRLIPGLTAALAAETDQTARRTIDFELRLLRDGHILEPAQGGGYNLTVHSAQGGVIGTWVEESDLRAKGVEKLASELRKR